MAVSALAMAVVDRVSGYVPPDPVLATCTCLPKVLLLLTLALTLSTRLSTLATGVVVVVFGAAWLAGGAGSPGSSFSLSALWIIGPIGRFILPTDGLWHGVMYDLEPKDLIVGRTGDGEGGNPFFAQSGPGWGYLVWVVVWFLAVAVPASSAWRGGNRKKAGRLASARPLFCR